MARTDQDDEFYANNPRRLQFTVVDEDNADAPFDLTSFTVRWAMSKMKPDGSFSTTPALTKTSEGSGGITVTDAAAGELYVDLEDVDSAALHGDYYHELEVFNADGEGVVVATGKLTINKNIKNAINQL